MAPQLPESPLYSSLHTNTPVPTMTFPGLPFPEGTPMFPSHKDILAYHHLAVEHFNLRQFLNFNHAVRSADWSDDAQQWVLELETPRGRVVRQFDHLILAVGRYRYPKVPTWAGQKAWLAAGDRAVSHSLWFRDPAVYAGRDVVVIGYGASGLDMASKVQAVGNATVYHSYEAEVSLERFPPIPGTVTKPRISHFTANEIVFKDGSTLASDKVTILLATGYSLEIPWLKPLAKVETLDPASHSFSGNGTYLRSLHSQLFAYDPRWPTNALALLALPYYAANAPQDFIQGLTVGHAIADDQLLPSREEARAILEVQEKELLAEGVDPSRNGHKWTQPGQAEAYQNGLATLLREKSRVPVPAFLGQPYVEDWRAWARGPTELGIASFVLRRAWQRALGQGVERQFVDGVATEEEWAAAMRRLYAWEVVENERDPWPLMVVSADD